MQNAQRRKEFRKYAAIVFKIVKSTELDFVANQIAIIYNKFDVKFQRNLIKFFNVISLNAFLRNINDCEKIR